MEITPTSLTPLKALDRIQSLDIMRGIVLLGILLMNINAMGLANAYENPTVSGGATGWSLYTWITTNMLFEGTMRSLFSLLFGVGMFILLERLDKNRAGMEAANIYFRRLTWLLVFGLIHGYLLLWTGEILYNYALMGFLVFSFRKMAPTKLILVAVLLISLGTLWEFSRHEDAKELIKNVATAEKYKIEGKELTPELQKASDEWVAMEAEKSPKAVQEYNANMRKGYFDVVSFLAPQNRHYNENDPYRYDVWDILSMMLIGIALFKWNILSAEKSFAFYGLLALCGYGIGLIINYYEINLLLKNNFSFLAFSQSFLTYYIGKTTLAMGHVALIMIFCKTPILHWLKKSLAAVGKMALTNYVMHSVFALFLFTGAGFGLFGTFQRHELLYIVFAIWIFQLIASPIWLNYFQFGPLEWLWRNLSYQKVYPLRKKRSE